MKTLGALVLLSMLAACGDDEAPANDTSSADDSAAQTTAATDSGASQTSALDTSEPAEDTTVPTQDTTVPTEDTTVPTEDTNVPTEDTTVPSEDTTVPAPDGVATPTCSQECPHWNPVCVAQDVCGQCATDTDCAGNPQVPHCTGNLPSDPWHCVECTTPAHCPSNAPRCDGSSCYACTSNADCSAPTPSCNTSGGPGWRMCWGCTSQSECSDRFCNTTSGGCEDCVDDASCTGHPRGTKCKSITTQGGVVKACACDTALECPDAAFPQCHPFMKMCTPTCDTDNDCTNAPGGMRRCDPVIKICSP